MEGSRMKGIAIHPPLMEIQPQKKMDRSAAPGPSDGPAFKDVLKEFVGDVNSLQIGADAKIASFAAGEVTDVHEVMIAVQKANIALDLTLEIRNRLIEAYQELMRMAV